MGGSVPETEKSAIAGLNTVIANSAQLLQTPHSHCERSAAIPLANHAQPQTQLGVTDFAMLLAVTI